MERQNAFAPRVLSSRLRAWRAECTSRAAPAKRNLPMWETRRFSGAPELASAKPPAQEILRQAHRPLVLNKSRRVRFASERRGRGPAPAFLFWVARRTVRASASLRRASSHRSEE